MNLRSVIRLLSSCSLLVTLASVAPAATYDEAISGDLSGTPASPTTWTLEAGPNALSGATGSPDVDLVHVVVPSGHVLTSLILDSYVDTAQTISFIGVANGPTWPTGLEYDVDAAAIMGWTHFGVTLGASVGDDLLPLMAEPLFSPGFSLPLPAGNYTFDVQDVDFSMNYAMTFNVVAVPEPAMLALVLPLAVAGRRLHAGRRRRRA